MEALVASYGEASSDSDSESAPPPPAPTSSMDSSPLPPPPLSLLNPPNSLGARDHSHGGQASRVRTFPHVEGNYAVHVYIPVYIPSERKKDLANFLKKVARVVPGLCVVDVDVPLDTLCKDDQKLEQIALGRELHISLGRTVPIRLHQIDSVVTMLRQKLQLHRRYWIDFSKWEVFVNDDCSRTFLSMEVISAGLAEVWRSWMEMTLDARYFAIGKQLNHIPHYKCFSNTYKIRKQIQAVNEVYKLHNLPEFYKNPRPHISLAWVSGNISNSLKNVIQEERKLSVGRSFQKCNFTCKFNGVECKIGKKTYKICKFSDK